MALSDKVCLNIEIESDIATAVNKAASANKLTAADVISDCIRQHLETAMRYRVILQRQGNVDEALMELARLIGRLSAGEKDIRHYRPVDGK